MVKLSGWGYTATILLGFGGNCIRLSKGGVEALRTPKDLQRYDGACLYGTPMLFPPNRISGAVFTFEGREYRFPVNEPATGCFLHGTLYQTPFRLLEQKPHSVTQGYRATDMQPYLTFPHTFTLILTYHLGEGGMTQRVHITNDSDRNMPVALGFHTTFALPLMPEENPKQVTLQLDTAGEYTRSAQNYLPDGGFERDHPLRRTLDEGTLIPAAQNLSALYAMGDRHEMVLTDLQSGAKVIYRAVQGYDYWMLFNGGNHDLVCVEPQSWLSNCPNAPFPREETGFQCIPPGSSRVFETLLKIDLPKE